MAGTRTILRVALLGGALLMIGAGIWIYLSSDEVTGAILAGLGVLDLLTIPFVLRVVVAGRSSQAPPGEDADYNPFARED
jgi:hypothetical protein